MDATLPFAYWTVLVAAVLPYVWVGFAKAQPGYDNAAPRAFLARTEGWRSRAHSAQLNAWEAFAPYAAAVIIAVTRGAPVGTVNLLCGAFLVFRVLHGLAYIADQGTARSVIWALGFSCVVGLFAVAA
jgi:uncharacterized MAPEG superfamily protein